MTKQRWVMVMIALVGIIIVKGAIIYNLVRFFGHVRQGRLFSTEQVRWRQHPANAVNRILIAGDSTAVGTGATEASLTIAGYFGADNPNDEIINIGVNGAKAAEIAQQLDQVAGQKFSLVVLMVGANDVLRLTDFPDVENSLNRVVTQAKVLSPRVLIFGQGNIGNAPLFPKWFAYILTGRSRQLRVILQKTADQQQVLFVDAFKERDHDLWRQQSTLYYAGDLFHPSSAGYRDWYTRMIIALDE